MKLFMDKLTKSGHFEFRLESQVFLIVRHFWNSKYPELFKKNAKAATAMNQLMCFVKNSTSLFHLFTKPGQKQWLAELKADTHFFQIFLSITVQGLRIACSSYLLVIKKKLNRQKNFHYPRPVFLNIFGHFRHCTKNGNAKHI